ncbi:unnamed protein product [Rotaria sp. Silwood1]|nr:unnamed protein product [Rotaria sp. Silwood1]CAF1356666.1 unnamed protein product [Rotaria sp. Silwood1]CAF4603471.1 unnamed protein product [Rotaria sp. Silwood1]
MTDEVIENTLDKDVEPSHPEISRRETTVSNTTWKENSPTIENLILIYQLVCRIDRKQIDIIQGSPENFVIPSQSRKESFGECFMS